MVKCLPDRLLVEGIRFGEKALAERCVNLIRKGRDGKEALGKLAACLQSAATLPLALADAPGYGSGESEISGGKEIAVFKKHVTTCAEALMTLCQVQGVRNTNAVQEVQKQRAATPGAATSLINIVNAALSTSRFWQDRMRDCLG